MMRSHCAMRGIWVICATLVPLSHGMASRRTLAVNKADNAALCQLHASKNPAAEEPDDGHRFVGQRVVPRASNGDELLVR
jgi:hypothetical protein